MDEITKEHWEQSLEVNKNLIIQNRIQMMMAEFVIEKCKIEIAKFPKEEHSD